MQVKGILVSAFRVVEECLKQQGLDMSASGTTTSVIFIIGINVYIATCGDSRVIMGSISDSGTIIATALSTDHRASLPSERARCAVYGQRAVLQQ